MVTGEMVEELIFFGVDIIKVGIGLGKLVYWELLVIFSVVNICGVFFFYLCYVFFRFCVYYSEENWSGLFIV